VQKKKKKKNLNTLFLSYHVKCIQNCDYFKETITLEVGDLRTFSTNKIVSDIKKYKEVYTRIIIKQNIYRSTQNLHIIIWLNNYYSKYLQI